MCGILLHLTTGSVDRKDFERRLNLMKHRGPDAIGIKHKIINVDGIRYEMLIGHLRLSIIDPESGAQPFEDDEGNILAVNGEIYNYRQLKDSFYYNYKTESDCEVLMPMMKKHDISEAEGQYAFIYTDDTDVYVARDNMGIVPLYIGYKNGNAWVSSELKAIDSCGPVAHVPPSKHPYSLIKHFPHVERTFALYDCTFDAETLKNKLIESVKMCMMSDVPWGVFLSGGLDSSLIASIASRYSDKPIKTYSVGLEGSPDLKSARKVAKFLRTDHTEYIVTLKQMMDVIPEVVWAVETYDITTIRASTPMFLLAREISKQGVKMCLSGEGADELFGGYLYFANAPTPEDFKEETIRLVKDLYMYDCLRLDKSTMSASVEARPPFLNEKFAMYVLSIDPEVKMHKKIEKRILREAFDDPESPWLPREVLWRQKEALSDGVGYQWVRTLKTVAQLEVSDDELGIYKQRYNCETKEEVYLRRTYKMLFDNDLVSYIWRPKWTEERDPSATLLPNHV